MIDMILKASVGIYLAIGTPAEIDEENIRCSPK